MKHIFFIVLILVFGFYTYEKVTQPKLQAGDTINAPTKSKPRLKLLDNTTKGDESTMYVYVKVKNISTEKIDFASAKITWFNKKGKMIDYGEGIEREINPGETRVIDRAFFNLPYNSRYEVELADQ